MNSWSNTEEPWALSSMGELLALARAMEKEAIDGYLALAERMRAEGRPDLAEVFDRLTAEERGHLGNVDRWVEARHETVPPAASLPEPLFDDEGAALVAPELLNSYRAFSMAVRNEERAFVFWTYVAAHAPSDEIREAAERMAMEELGHVATLRRERRRAFHQLRRIETDCSPGDLATLEMRLADHLESRAALAGGERGERLRAFARDAQARAAHLARTPPPETPILERVPDTVRDRLVPLCELILDAYLDLAERSKPEEERIRAQAFAGAVVQCLLVVRGLQSH